jgi:acyl-CoA synthetase (AMP-forming)/AMP-acid ligase II
LFGHPAIEDVVAIGLPHEKWGECVTAVIVPKAGAHIDPDDIIAHARQRIAGFKTPKRIEIVSEIPRNAAGKALRRELRAKFTS